MQQFTHQIWVPRLQRWRKGLKQPIRDKLQQVRSHDERWTWRWHSEHHLDKPGKTDIFNGLNQKEKGKWLPALLSSACNMACKYSSFSSLLASCAEFPMTRHAIFTPLRKTAWRKTAWRTMRPSAAGWVVRDGCITKLNALLLGEIDQAGYNRTGAKPVPRLPWATNSVPSWSPHIWSSCGARPEPSPNMKQNRHLRQLILRRTGT